MRIKIVLAVLGMFFLSLSSWAQPTQIGNQIDYAYPQKFTVANIVVLGAQYTDHNAIKLFAGIQIGEEIEIPGDRITKAIKNLWDQKLFSDISIYAAEFRGSDVYLIIELSEMPRLVRYKIDGLRKTEVQNLKDDLGLTRGQIVNENRIEVTKNRVIDHFTDKGFFNVDVKVETPINTSIDNGVDMDITVDKGSKVKIDHIAFVGANSIEHKKLYRTMKDTKEKRWWRIFKSSKYLEPAYKTDKKALIAKYNTAGFRNAKITGDSIYTAGDGLLGIQINVDEGSKFYFRDLSFSGNTKYRTTYLDSILGIQRGDVYDLQELETKLFMNPKGADVSSKYQDEGYLTFQAIPVEVLVEDDQIDIEVRIFEGKQFRIGNVTVTGNTKTNDPVIYREIRTRPGDLFSRTDIIRTQRELAQLGYFNPESFGINPIQDDQKGTVDIEYVVEEKPSDQIELSGGWGGGRVIGSLGVSFTNFAIKDVFKKGAWRPVPTGDGQRLSLRAQSNGRFLQAYSASFTEPWLGGKKPNSLSFSLSYTESNRTGVAKWIDGERNPNLQLLKVWSASVGLGQRLQKPDDWFLSYLTLTYQNFNLENFQQFFNFGSGNGVSNNLSLQWTLQRNSVSDPIFPTWGSNVKFSVKATAPYSLIGKGKDYSTMTDDEKFKWVEYHKWKFTVNWYTPLTRPKNEENPRRLVLATNFGVGFMGSYNQNIGLSPFERFYLGGIFFSGFQLDGREVINLRGYDDLSLTAPDSNTGSPMIIKYNAELRYPLSTNPNATIYAMSFLEAGNTWATAKEFNPFNVKRSAGVGLRIFLPMFGLLGLDYGWRLDDVDNAPGMARGQFHFSLGMNIGEL